MEFVNALVPANNLAIPFATFVPNAVVNSRIFPERKLNAEDIGMESILPSLLKFDVTSDEEIAFDSDLAKLPRLEITGLELTVNDRNLTTPNMLSATLEIACAIAGNLKVARSLGMLANAVREFCIDLKRAVWRKMFGISSIFTKSDRPPRYWLLEGLVTAMPSVTFLR